MRKPPSLRSSPDTTALDITRSFHNRSDLFANPQLEESSSIQIMTWKPFIICLEQKHVRGDIVLNLDCIKVFPSLHPRMSSGFGHALQSPFVPLPTWQSRLPLTGLLLSSQSFSNSDTSLSKLDNDSWYPPWVSLSS